MTEKTTQAPKRTRGERQKDSVYTKRYAEKRQIYRAEINLYADDPAEAQMIEKIKQLKAEKNLKPTIIQALTEFFEKNQK